MALDSVPPYPSDLGSSRAAAARTQQRIRKEERTWTSDTYAPYDDGHQWRKYGEKKLSNSHFPRFYYRCTYKNDMKCPATKQVQQKDTSDPPLFSVTYFNQHTCSTSSSAVGSARDITSQSPSKKAVSICFSPHAAAASEQTSFMTTTTVAPPVMRSYGANRQPDRSAYSQQPDRGAYARQPQWWTGEVPSPASNGPAKMEVAESAQQPSASYGSAGAPSRTLLPIGQSRCIEYFHFL